jgi:hypothetical protein
VTFKYRVIWNSNATVTDYRIIKRPVDREQRSSRVMPFYRKFLG